MEKSEIRTLIINRSDRVKFVENSQGVSDVWQAFHLVNVDTEYCGYVHCHKCHQLLKWKSKDGTSGLNNHIKSCKPGEMSKSLSIKEIFTAKVASRGASLSAEDKSAFTDCEAKMCASDIRPFSIVEGSGFREVAANLISIGARYGNISVNKVLPAARTVSRHVSDVAKKEKQDLASNIGFEGHNMWFGITTDGWKEWATSTNYYTVTLHLIDCDWHTNSRILGTRILEERSTVDNVLNLVEDVLHEFGALRTSNVFVTDNGSNMVAAFKKN